MILKTYWRRRSWGVSAASMLWASATAVIFATIAWWGWWAWPSANAGANQMAEVAAPQGVKATQSRDTSKHVWSSEALSRAVSRPLQRPLYDPPPPTPEAPPPPSPLQLKLVGIVMEPGRPQAIVRLADGSSRFVLPGDAVAGATVLRVGPDSIQLLYHGQTLDLRTEAQ